MPRPCSRRTPVRSTYDGHDCFVYRVDLPVNDGHLAVEAFADVQTINSLASWPGPRAQRRRRPSLGRIAARGGECGRRRKQVRRRQIADRRRPHRQGRAMRKGSSCCGRCWPSAGRRSAARRCSSRATGCGPTLRGANAVQGHACRRKWNSRSGPARLLECISPTEARLHTGEAASRMCRKHERCGVPFDLLGAARRQPRSSSRRQAARARRSRRKARRASTQPPVWLTGFEGTSNNESLGSLIVNLPDGRNVPLTVGYHKVSVEIRDQIARTDDRGVVRQSHATAGWKACSISRCRRMRRSAASACGSATIWSRPTSSRSSGPAKSTKRSSASSAIPACWNGPAATSSRPACFRSRPHSEKRIKIVYTQVLPLRGNRYRYSYGLRSELLQTQAAARAVARRAR